MIIIAHAAVAGESSDFITHFKPASFQSTMTAIVDCSASMGFRFSNFLAINKITQINTVLMMKLCNISANHTGAPSVLAKNLADKISDGADRSDQPKEHHGTG